MDSLVHRMDEWSDEARKAAAEARKHGWKHSKAQPGRLTHGTYGGHNLDIGKGRAGWSHFGPGGKVKSGVGSETLGQHLSSYKF